MPARRWYAPILVLAVATITIGAAFSIQSVRGWRVLGPFAHRAAPAAHVVSPKPAAPVAPAPVQPASPAPADVAAVQAGAPAPVRPAKRWHPSDRQALRDRVYLAGKQNRPADAIAALEDWDARHPGDPEVLRELARLLARSPNPYDAASRYRELLAIQPDPATRTEYAAALLAMQQYDSAAANYRILIDDDSTSAQAHLGLARALSWSNHPREAEPELEWLLPRMPEDTTLRAMLHVARASFNPSSREAQRWVEAEPTFTPYRLALARALVREQRPGASAAQFDTVLALDPKAPITQVREAASVHAMASDSSGSARLLGRAVGLAPRDTALRAQYAEALSWSGDRTAAIAQYDTLLMAGDDASLLLARGRLYAWTGNTALAERDLTASNAIQESAGTWVMLGDLARWRGDRVHAREAYARANVLSPGEPGALSGFQAIAEAERREVAAILSRELGWSAAASYLGDNAGFSLYTEGIGGGFAVADRTALTLAVDARRLDSLNGESGRVGVVSYVGGYRLSVEGGVAHYARLGDFGLGSFSLAGPWGRTWISSDLRAGPAYQSLMSAGRLTYTGASVSLTVPAGLAAFSAGVDQMWLSDGNARTSVQLGARYRLGYGLSAVYSGGVIRFEHASDVYWDPRHFASHALGLELATHSDSGFSVSARVLPGIGVGTELLSGRSDPNERNAAQLSSGFAIDYRKRWWAMTLDGDYAKGVRQSDYHAARASLRIRITP